jgi:hypothetical protein
MKNHDISSVVVRGRLANKDVIEIPRGQSGTSLFG